MVWLATQPKAPSTSLELDLLSIQSTFNLNLVELYIIITTLIITI